MRKILLILFLLILIPSVSALNLSKYWSEINKTLIIKNNDNLAATIELISINPDLTTFEETFNLTAYVNYTFDDLKDFKTRWNVIKGRNNIDDTKWYIQKNNSYNVSVDNYGLIEHSQVIPNISTYTNITSTWNQLQLLDLGVENSKLKYKLNFSHNDTNYINFVVGFDYWTVITPSPLKVNVFWNTTGIIGTKEEIRYSNDWEQFNPSGKSMVEGKSYIFKLVYTKKAELGDINIQTIPMFMGFEEQKYDMVEYIMVIFHK